MDKTPQRLAFEAAIDKAGGITRLSRNLGLHRSAVGKWVGVPAKHALAVERLTGVPATDLRPDIYPKGLKT